MPNKETKEVRLLLSDARSTVDRLDRFQEFLQTITALEVIDELKLEQLNIRLDQIKPTMNKYEDIAVRLHALTTNIDPTLEQFEERYFNLVAQANNIIKHMQVNQSISSNNSSTFSNNRSSTPHMGERRVKLPILNPPTFNGHYSEWTSFHEAFTALIDNNPDLSNVEKFFYLQNALKGSAKDQIHELPATASNYEIAMNMLKERYNNEKLIIHSHLEALFDINKLTKESGHELRKFYDKLTRHLRALDNLKLSDESFKAAVISYMVKTKLDTKTTTEFSKFKVKKIPSIAENHTFLSERCITLEDIDNNQRVQTQSNDKTHFSKSQISKVSNAKQSFVVTNNKTCGVCKSSHPLYFCPTFLGYSVRERFNKANELKICKNCLSHDVKVRCNSKFKCKSCQGVHNSLLCFGSEAKKEPDSNANLAVTTQIETTDLPSSSNSSEATDVLTQLSLSCTNSNPDQVLLSTAVIKVNAVDGTWHTARCLLDSASQSSFVSQEFCSRIKCKPTPTNAVVFGINSNAAKSQGLVNLKIASLHENYSTELPCLVIPKITQDLPLITFSKSDLLIPNNIKLADNNFNKSAPIDVLIGASLFYDLLATGQVYLGKGKPTLQNTLLGWVISGNFTKRHTLSNSQIVSAICTNQNDDGLVSNEDLHSSLSNFWQIDDVNPTNKYSLLSSEEKFCEKHFLETVSQNPNGQLVVSIPFNSKLTQLGESKQQALERFYSLEKKFRKNSQLREDYSKFIHEYIALGHMTKVDIPSSNIPHSKITISTLGSDVCLDSIPDYYLPHHAVIKTSSLTTKLRVVFDGSARSDSNISINQAQCVGPVIQDELFEILLRFRQHKIALTADIEKMYRMILIDPDQRKLQRIFWRDSPNDPIDTYELNTITYGTTSASYLATRCLQYLSDQNRDQFPKTCTVLSSSFYMDDLLFTAATVDEVIQVKNELIAILAAAGFSIRKFLSNDLRVLSESENPSTSFFNFPLGERSNAKALGLAWNSLSDVIHYDVKINFHNPIKTKRTILSTVSQLFDPLGLLSPVIVRGTVAK